VHRSVLAQTYQNWDFTIVNNCSTDDTLRVCLKYAAIDSRIRVVTNPSFLKIIENHNRTLTYLSSQAKYCKVVFAMIGCSLRASKSWSPTRNDIPPWVWCLLTRSPATASYGPACPFPAM